MKLFNKGNNVLNKKRTKLEIVLERANYIKKTNGNDGIYDLIRALLYPTMYQHLYRCLTADKHKAPIEPTYFDFFPYINREFPECTIISEQDREKYPVYLGKDIVFTTPWHPDRIINHLGYIGHRVNFEEDTRNHSVILYSPMNVYLVTNGYHSIMQGILNCNGVIHAKELYDLSNELKRYTYNGKYWIDNQTNQKLPVLNDDFSLVWEISKLID